jgi:hypothetical protein
MLKIPTRRFAPVLAVAFAAGLAGASTASADFSLARCTGEPIIARGASFQNAAFTGWQTAFANATAPGCGATAPLVTLQASGSGAGRQALGVKGGVNAFQDRDVSIRFAASDEPLTATDRAQIEKGPIDANGVDVTAADDNPVHLIPVAIGSAAVMVHLPNDCDYTGAANKPLDGNRPAIDNATLEAAFAGATSADTWGELIPGVDATCAAKPVVRVVRQDSSGTTFAFKQLLARINPARGWAALGNTAWPNLATNPVYRSKTSGGGSLVTALSTGALATTQRDNGSGLVDTAIDYAATGGIGYVDLATARTGAGGSFLWADAATDKTFWLPLQRGTAADPKAGTTYDDPQANANGYKLSVSNAAGGPRGASCNVVNPRNVPTTPADPTLGSWATVDATATGLGYAACTLTYQIAFDDNAVVYCNSASEERKARTLKDYLTLVTDTAGQNVLAGQDYAALPADVATIARNGVAAIGWKKNGSSGRPCQPVQENPGGDDDQDPEATPTPTATPIPGVPTPTPVAPPAPTAPSNQFTVSSARVSGTTIKLSLQLPGVGNLAITSSAKPKKGAAVKLANKTAAVTKAGAQSVSLTLSAKAKTALRKNKSLKFSLKITYTPTGGSANTVTKTVTVKQPKAKSKK